MWGTDATRFYTTADGWCWIFGAIDHCLDEVVGCTPRRSATAGRRSSRSDRACATLSVASPRTSRAG
jgi:hypothetical protein